MRIAPCCSVNAAFLFAELRMLVVLSRCAPEVLLYVRKDNLRRVVAGGAGHLAAGMRAGAAKIKVGDRSPIV